MFSLHSCQVISILFTAAMFVFTMFLRFFVLLPFRKGQFLHVFHMSSTWNRQASLQNPVLTCRHWWFRFQRTSICLGCLLVWLNMIDTFLWTCYTCSYMLKKCLKLTSSKSLVEKLRQGSWERWYATCHFAEDTAIHHWDVVMWYLCNASTTWNHC